MFLIFRTPIISLLAMICFASCSEDLFKRVGDSAFYLHRYPENGRYYIVQGKKSEPGVGFLDGTVEMIGYSEPFILVELRSVFLKDGKRLPNDFHLIDARNNKSKKIERSEISKNPKLNQIKLLSPELFFNHDSFPEK